MPERAWESLKEPERAWARAWPEPELDNNDNDDEEMIKWSLITDLPAGGELVCVRVQGEGVGGDGDLVHAMYNDDGNGNA